MKLGRKYLLVLLRGTLLPLALVLIEIGMGGLVGERLISFGCFISAYWFAIALSLWMAMVLLASLTCVAVGKRLGKQKNAICMQQAMLRYGNCLAGRDGDDGINAPLPLWR